MRNTIIYSIIALVSLFIFTGGCVQKDDTIIVGKIIKYDEVCPTSYYKDNICIYTINVGAKDGVKPGMAFSFEESKSSRRNNPEHVISSVSEKTCSYSISWREDTNRKLKNSGDNGKWIVIYKNKIIKDKN